MTTDPHVQNTSLVTHLVISNGQSSSPPSLVASPPSLPQGSISVMKQASIDPVGSGIVVVTNSSGGGGSILAIDTSTPGLTHSSAYEPPQGWSSIGDVAFFSLIIFIPVVLYLFVQFLRKESRSEIGIVAKLKFCGNYISRVACAGCANFYRLRHVRGEDSENLGSEGALYLALHRETLILLIVLTLIGCFILLPIHFSAGNTNVQLDFARGTIQHIGKHSKLLWVHVALIFLTSALYFRYVWRCRSHVQWAWQCGVIKARSTELWDASVFIKSKIPEFVSEDEVKRLLELIYPNQVENVVIIMDQSQVAMVENKRIEAEQELSTLKRFESFRDDDPDTLSLVQQKLDELDELRELKEQLGDRHAGKGIVTFKSKELAVKFADYSLRKQAVFDAIDKLHRMNDDENVNKIVTQKQDLESLEDEELELESYRETEISTKATNLKTDIVSSELLNWETVPSPDPHDIIWESLHLNKKVYWLRTLVSNVVILCVLFLLTTPTALLALVSNLHIKSSEKTYQEYLNQSFMVSLYHDYPTLGAFLFAFLPQIFFLAVNDALLLTIFIVAKYWEPHHTLSSQQISVLGKSFWFLMFNIVIVPSVAFSSLGGFVGDLISSEASPFATLGQIFIVTSGAFTLSYIIAQTFVGTSMQLINLPDIAWRFFFGTAIFRPWSSAEDRRKVLESKMTFEFGSEYASFLSMLALIVMFSDTVPIVLPFGVIYFGVKLGADQYQLHFECGQGESHSVPRCKIGRAAVTYLPIPLICYQLVSLGYFSTYVCLPNEITAIASGQHPRGCTIPSESDPTIAIPGTQAIRGTIVQLLLLFSLVVYTSSDYLYSSMVDANNDEGLVLGAGFAEQPYVSAVLQYTDEQGDSVSMCEWISSTFKRLLGRSSAEPVSPQDDSLEASHFNAPLQNDLRHEHTGLLSDISSCGSGEDDIAII